MKMKIALFVIALLLASQVFADSKRKCQCVSAKAGETTREGANQRHKFKEDKTYKYVHGVVLADDLKPMEDVLIEIFDKPEWILQEDPKSPYEQRRVAVCKTNAYGRFCFENLPAGEYELRASKDAQWNISHVYVTVDPRSRKGSTAAIEVELYLGT
jgi:protocatechuate 3,4-dioxygenase beta subunit